MIQRRNFLSRTLASAASLGLLGANKASAGPGPQPATTHSSGRKPTMMFYHDGRHPLIIHVRTSHAEGRARIGRRRIAGNSH